MSAHGIGDLDFSGLSRRRVKFDGDGVIPFGGEVDLRRSGDGLGGGQRLAMRLRVLVAVLGRKWIADNGKLGFFRG